MKTVFAALLPLALASITKYELEAYDSVADANAVVTKGSARFTVLTDRIIRMEYQASGAFEDRPSLAVVNRKLLVPSYTVDTNDSALFITTKQVRLTYILGQEFTPETLRVDPVTASATAFAGWHFGMESWMDEGNLLGTFRTLDRQNVDSLNCSTNGQPHCEFGLISQSGWAVINDTGVPVLDEEDFWADASGNMHRNSDDVDLYLLAHGHDYTDALLEYTQIGGRIPIAPRYTTGIWWTRWMNLGTHDMRGIVEEYELHGLPLDVFVIDMDWHTKNDWTGYSWDPNLFPYPSDTLAWLREEKGLAVSANLHDADGVNSWETRYEAMCEALGRDPKAADRVNFTLVDINYTRALEDVVLKPLEDEGMDFWWIDWQQGESGGGTGQDGPRLKMNPTIWTDKMRVTDTLRRCRNDATCKQDLAKRGVVLARFGGLGNHRYQLGFSGDVAELTWENLAYQPYFSLTASNVGYGFWSHDIVGPGDDPEMYTRWVQWASFSAVMRSHDRGMSSGGCEGWPATYSPHASCPNVEPWKVPQPYFQPIRSALRSRARLVPYLYTLWRDAYDTGVSALRPCYYEWPEEKMAYAANQEGEFPQYLLGPDLLVRPVVAPASNDTNMASSSTWVPPGDWLRRGSGRVFTGPMVDTRDYDLSEIPIFARAGAIIPESPLIPGATTGTAAKQFTRLDFSIVPGGKSGSTKIYEDDGATYAYLSGGSAWTLAEYQRDGLTLNMTVTTTGDYDGIPETRDSITLRVESAAPLASATVNGESLALKRFGGEGSFSYDGPAVSAVVQTGQVDTTGSGVTFQLKFAYEAADAYELSGIQGIVSKANLAKVNIDVTHQTPGQTSPVKSAISQLAGMGEALGYLASNPETISDFRTLANSAAAQLKAAYAELQGVEKVDQGRLNYSLALLASEMA